MKKVLQSRGHDSWAAPRKKKKKKKKQKKTCLGAYADIKDLDQVPRL